MVPPRWRSARSTTVRRPQGEGLQARIGAGKPGPVGLGAQAEAILEYPIVERCENAGGQQHEPDRVLISRQF